MLKKILTTIISCVLSAAAIIFFLVWFTAQPGVPGLLVWHTDIAKIPLLLKVGLVLINVVTLVTVFLLLRGKKAGKAFAVISLILNVLFFIGSVGLTSVLAVRANVKKGCSLEVENPWYKADLKTLSNIAVSSDPHWDNEKSDAAAREQILKTIGSENHDAFFCLGDISDFGDVDGTYDAPVKAFNENLNGTPLFAMMGNHDALITSAKVFNKVFYGNEKAPQYFCMKYGDVYFIVMDLLWGAEELDSKQLDWIEAALKNIPRSEKVIALSHAFFYSSGYVDKDYGKNWFDNPQTIEKLGPLFESYGVDLVISGHNHLMEVLEKDGVTYAIIGAMGGALDPIEYTSPYSVWLNNTDHGYMDMDLSAKDEINFDIKDPNGNILYSHTIKTNK